MKLALLWTDILIFFLVACVLAFAWYARNHEHLRDPWKRVTHNSAAMGALVVLSVYVVIGLMDSIHFHPRLENTTNGTLYSNEIISAFDVVVTPLRSRGEKTYSAPLAVIAYAKETVDLPNGGQQRIYPLLNHAGNHLADPVKQRRSDQIKLSILGAVKGGAAILVLIGLLGLLLARRQQLDWLAAIKKIFANQYRVRWRAFVLTSGTLLLLGFIATELSTHYHLFGTDKIGEDVFYQTLKSIRTGLVIGTLTTLVMLPFAILLGIMAGYFGGRVDDVIQYLYTTLSSIPGVLLIAATILMLQVYLDNNAAEFTSITERADLRLLFLCLILGVTSWTGLCRYLRGESLKLREIDYIQAAHSLGADHFTIMLRHILPNVMHIVLITVVLDFSGLVLAEAVLSYVQIGVDPTMNSWGNMINSARLEMAREPIVWWSLMAAFILMFTLILAANLFSDAVRDAFDPRLRDAR